MEGKGGGTRAGEKCGWGNRIPCVPCANSPVWVRGLKKTGGHCLKINIGEHAQPPPKHSIYSNVRGVDKRGQFKEEKRRLRPSANNSI
jgi:hypothetical protein